VARRATTVVLVLVLTAACGESATPGAAPAPPSMTFTRDAVLGPPLAGQQPRLPADPQPLAQYLTVAEDALRDGAESADRIAAAGWVTQHAYRALSRLPEWRREVLQALPYRYRTHARHLLRANESLAGELTEDELPTRMPAWRIVTPEPPAALRRYYAAGQKRYGVPWQVLAAVNLVETRMGRIVGLSSAGARGPMQFMPATWRAYGRGDIDDARDSILAAARYLAANGAADGTAAGLRTALRRYNNSSYYVTGVLRYVAALRADDRVYAGMHAWQVYYRTRAGEALLQVGYVSRGNPPARRWLAAHPEARVRYF
jgi:membrane-bound lytic murein transglycosylase B